MQKEKKSRNRIEIRIYDYINNILIAKANEKTNGNISEYIRLLILQDSENYQKIMEAKQEKKEKQRLLYEVNKIGNNLNQITMQINAGKYISSRDVIQNLNEVKSILISLLSEMGS